MSTYRHDGSDPMIVFTIVRPAAITACTSDHFFLLMLNSLLTLTCTSDHFFDTGMTFRFRVWIRFRWTPWIFGSFPAPKKWYLVFGMFPIRIESDASRCILNALLGFETNPYLRFKTRYMWSINEIGTLLTIAMVVIVVLLIFAGSKSNKDDDFNNDLNDHFSPSI
jgi:hypothetical protein